MRILTNISYLNEAIDYYEKIEKYSPYLFMSKETIERCPCYMDVGMFNSFLKYDDCKVFENNALNFFEVELR